MSVLLLSGGVDSAVLLARECAAGRPPFCLSFDYGQRHRRELKAAARLAAHYGVEQRIFCLPPSLLAGSALTGGQEVPRGLDYRDPGQAATVVPGRNLVFLALAAAQAIQRNVRTILIAAHRGDAAVYPDCRQGFLNRVDEALESAYGVRLEAPFITMTKRDIVLLGRVHRVPLDLAWSCYQGGTIPCQQCGACIERREAEA